MKILDLNSTICVFYENSDEMYQLIIMSEKNDVDLRLTCWYHHYQFFLEDKTTRQWDDFFDNSTHSLSELKECNAKDVDETLGKFYKDWEYTYFNKI